MKIIFNPDSHWKSYPDYIAKDNSPLEQFLAEVKTNQWTHPFISRDPEPASVYKHEDFPDVQLFAIWCRRKDAAQLSYIIVDNQGKGAGTAYMKEVIETADKYGVTINLLAQTPRLKRWYKSLGFKTKPYEMYMTYTPKKTLRMKNIITNTEPTIRVLCDEWVEAVRSDDFAIVDGMYIDTDWTTGERSLIMEGSPHLNNEYNTGKTVTKEQWIAAKNKWMTKVLELFQQFGGESIWVYPEYKRTEFETYYECRKWFKSFGFKPSKNGGKGLDWNIPTNFNHISNG